jgi:hypothetical protein
MDPVVRAALGLQQLIARIAGVGFSLAFAAYLVWSTASHGGGLWDGLWLALLVVATLVCAVRRFRAPNVEGAVRLDLDLFLHLTVVAFAVVLRLPGGLDGPGYAGLYALTMLAAAFARPAVAAGTLSFAVLLEAGLDYFTTNVMLSERLLAHAGLLGLFTFLNMVVFRAEIARVRRLSRSRIESEIEKMKEAARSYRLFTVPSAAAPPVAPRDDETRLLRSGVDEIGHALQFALDLLPRHRGSTSRSSRPMTMRFCPVRSARKTASSVRRWRKAKRSACAVRRRRVWCRTTKPRLRSARCAPPRCSNTDSRVACW